MKTIIWIRPSGKEIETNSRQSTIDKYIGLGWKRAKGKTEDQIKKEMEEEAEKVKKEMDALLGKK